MNRQDYLFNKKVDAEWYQRNFPRWVKIAIGFALLAGVSGGFVILIMMMRAIHVTTDIF